MSTGAAKLAAARRYKEAHREELRLAARRYRRKHRRKVRAYYWRVARAVQIARRKQILGRRCEVCDRSDGEAYWSSLTSVCNTCARRASRNGRCRECLVPISKTSGQGCRAERRCACPTDLELSLWDALRWHESEAVTYAELAALMRCSLKRVERHRDAILEVLRRHDPGARREADVEANGQPMRFLFSPSRVRRGLERLVLREAS